MNLTLNVQPSKLSYKNAKVMEYLTANVNDISIYDVNYQTLRTYVKIKNNKPKLDFQISSKNDDWNSEKVVDNNDMFIITDLALGFISVPIEKGVEEPIENQKIIFFPSPSEFAYLAPGSTVAQYQAMESIYYSHVTIESGQDKLVTELDARGLRRNPIYKLENNYTYEDGEYMELAQYPIINGGTKTGIVFNIPSANTQSIGGDPNKQALYAVLLSKGFNISDLAKPYSEIYKDKNKRRIK